MNSKKQEINWKLIGASEHINYLRREIEYVAKKIKTLDMAVLISGPSGTGKELIAKAIAEQSGLKLVTINCGAIPRELFESELFGYVPGAFTGALKKGKKGFVEAAKGGILFLDEIGDLTLENQGKVLRLLQERTYYKVGSEQEEKAEDLKILAATNRVLTKEIIEKRFREDLWYRLKHRNVQTIPLKDRRVDIICLVNHFVNETKVKIDPKVKFLLYSYDFPGNVRELESLIYSSDDFEYVKTALIKNIASTIEIDVEVISKYDSLNDFDNAISMEDMLDMTHEWRRKERGEEDLSWRESLLRNTEANEFFRATFFAEENDCSDVVGVYEIMTLRLCPGLPKDGIAQILHIGNEKVYDKCFKETFGFDFSQEGEIISYSEPMKIYPYFTNYWGYKKKPTT